MTAAPYRIAVDAQNLLHDRRGIGRYLRSTLQRILPAAEVGRVAYLRHLGLDYRTAFLDRGIDFTIGEAHLLYRAPLRFDDEFDIKVRVGKIRHSSWTFEYAFDRADGLHCAEASTVQVVIGREGTPRARRMPEALRMILENARGVAGT